MGELIDINPLSPDAPQASVSSLRQKRDFVDSEVPHFMARHTSPASVPLPVSAESLGRDPLKPKPPSHADVYISSMAAMAKKEPEIRRDYSSGDWDHYGNLSDY